MKEKKNIVIIGGGNGSAITINAIKSHIDKFIISAVVSVSDSGGSSGRLRKEFRTLPAGDVLRAVLAMSPYDYQTLKRIFHKNRFRQSDKLSGHNLGNLFLVLAEKYGGDYLSAVRALEQAVEAVGMVYPVTLDITDLQVKLSNGRVLRSEEEIDRPDYNRGLRIKKAWLEPEAEIYVEAKKAIENAVVVILGPGSLYTSVVAALLPVGVSEAIKKSKAKLIYVMGNAFEINGETGPTKMSEFVKELQAYLPRKIDLVVYNNHRLTAAEKKNYHQRQWQTFAVDKENLRGYNILAGDYDRKGGGLCPEKLGKVLKKIIK